MKKFIALLLAVAMLFALAACGGKTEAPAATSSTPATSNAPAAAPAGEKVTLKVTHCQAEGHPINDAALLFADIVNEKTDGRITVDLYPANMLGAESVTRDMVKEGTVDVVILGSAANNYNTAMNLVSAFYLLQNVEEADYMLFDSNFAQKYMKDEYLADHGVVYLDSWTQSPRQTMTTKPFTTPEELKSIKLRVPAGIPVWETGWNYMGAMTVSMGLDDAFSGLQQGVCDGVEGPIEQLYFYSFQEVAKNLIQTEHCYYSYQFLMNANVWNGLSADDQQIIKDALVEAHKLADEKRDANVDLLVSDMESQGVKVTALTDAQKQVFADLALAAVQDNMETWGQDVYDEFIAELEEFRASH